MGNDLFLYGSTYIDRFVNGAPTGSFYKLANNDELAITPQSEIKEKKSRTKENFGNVESSVALVDTPTIKLVTSDSSAEILAMALLGELATEAQTEASSVGVLVTAAHGRWVSLGYKRITSVSNPSMTEGEDYELNKDQGLIKFLDGGHTTDGEPYIVNVTAPALANQYIDGSRQPTIYAHVLFDGVNNSDGRDVRCEVYKARLRPTSALPMIGEDFTNVTLEGVAELPGDGRPAYRWWYLDTAAV